MISGDEKEFNVNRWMSRSHDDGDVWREIPVAAAGQKPLPGKISIFKLKCPLDDQK